MSNVLKKRSPALIQALKSSFWPIVRAIFQLKVEGLDNVPTKGPLLFVSNHNVGALLESHSALFTLPEKLGADSIIYGFTHPSIFKIPGIKNYFELIGAVPATYEVAEEVFKNHHSLMIATIIFVGVMAGQKLHLNTMFLLFQFRLRALIL